MTDFALPTSSKTVIPGVKAPSAKAATKEPAQDPSVAEDNKEKKADAAPQFSEEELMKIFDDLIFGKEYQETVYIRPNFPVTFRTRTSAEYDDIQRSLDSSGFNLMSSVENLRSVRNLTYALVDIKGSTLPLGIAEKSKFIEELPGPVIGLLLDRLSKFDYKVMMACKSGDENF